MSKVTYLRGIPHLYNVRVDRFQEFLSRLNVLFKNWQLSELIRTVYGNKAYVAYFKYDWQEDNMPMFMEINVYDQDNNPILLNRKVLLRQPAYKKWVEEHSYYRPEYLTHEGYEEWIDDLLARDDTQDLLVQLGIDYFFDGNYSPSMIRLTTHKDFMREYKAAATYAMDRG